MRDMASQYLLGRSKKGTPIWLHSSFCEHWASQKARFVQVSSRLTPLPKVTRARSHLIRMVANGFTILRAIRSAKWPSSMANLEYASIWGINGNVGPNIVRICDNIIAGGISSLLEPEGQDRLFAPSTEGKRRTWFTRDAFCLEWDSYSRSQKPRNGSRRIPAISKCSFRISRVKMSNSRPDLSASRWAIDFNDRSEAAAASYELPFHRIKATVYDERIRNKRKSYSDYWWRYAENRPAMRRAIAGSG